MSGLESKLVLSYACVHLCRPVCLKCRVYMLLGGHPFSGGVYAPCIYSHVIRELRSVALVFGIVVFV